MLSNINSLYDNNTKTSHRNKLIVDVKLLMLPILPQSLLMLPHTLLHKYNFYNNKPCIYMSYP